MNDRLFQVWVNGVPKLEHPDPREVDYCMWYYSGYEDKVIQVSRVRPPGRPAIENIMEGRVWYLHRGAYLGDSDQVMNSDE